ncbi:MAG: hypothetical protein V1929_09165 [bacterium]
MSRFGGMGFQMAQQAQADYNALVERGMARLLETQGQAGAMFQQSLSQALERRERKKQEKKAKKAAKKKQTTTMAIGAGVGAVGGLIAAPAIAGSAALSPAVGSTATALGTTAEVASGLLGAGTGAALGAGMGYATGNPAAGYSMMSDMTNQSMQQQQFQRSGVWHDEEMGLKEKQFGLEEKDVKSRIEDRGIGRAMAENTHQLQLRQFDADRINANTTQALNWLQLQQRGNEATATQKYQDAMMKNTADWHQGMLETRERDSIRREGNRFMRTLGDTAVDIYKTWKGPQNKPAQPSYGDYINAAKGIGDGSAANDELRNAVGYIGQQLGIPSPGSEVPDADVIADLRQQGYSEEDIKKLMMRRRQQFPGG